MMLDVNKPYFGAYSFYVPFALIKAKLLSKKAQTFQFPSVLICISGKKSLGGRRTHLMTQSKAHYEKEKKTKPKNSCLLYLNSVEYFRFIMKSELNICINK